MIGQSAPEPVTIRDQRRDRCDGEHRLEDVEERDTAHRERQTIECQQDAGQRTDERRAGEPPCEADREHDEQRPRDDGREPPPERIEPEHHLAEADEELAERGMGDEITLREHAVEVAAEDLVVRVLRPLHLVAMLHEGPRILRVVRLVEHDPVRTPQIPDPQDEREERNTDGDQPGQEPVPETAPVFEGFDGRRHEGESIGWGRE